MIQCLAFGEGYVDYFDEGTVELATCGISEATNAVIAPGPQESRGDLPAQVVDRAGQESEIPNFKGSFLGRFPLVSADFWTSDHLSERSRSVNAFSGTRARETLTLKRH